MLLVPYPFASILSIVFPSLRFLSNLHAFIFGLRAVYSFACFASQTQGVCSAFPRPSFEFVRVCLSPIVLRTSPHKHRVCAMLFPRSPLKFVRLCLLCYVMRTSSHKHRVCALLLPSVPFWVCTLMCHVLLYVLRLTTFGFVQRLHLGSLWILHACVFMFCLLRLANTRFVQCFFLGPFWVCTLVFVTVCYAYFASQTSGLCSAFLSA